MPISGVIDDVSERINIFHMIVYLHIPCHWCQNIRIIFLIIKPMDCCYRCYQELFDTFPNTVHIIIIIITRLFSNSKIIPQYFDNFLFYNFTTSSLKIDQPSSTFQLCHSWLGTLGNSNEYLIVGSLNMRFK